MSPLSSCRVPSSNGGNMSDIETDPETEPDTEQTDPDEVDPEVNEEGTE